MSEVLAKWMMIFIAITIIFTPLLAYTDSLHREAVDTVLHQSMKQASLKGQFTSNIVDEIKDTLEKDYNFDRSKIEIEATTTLTSRGGYLECTITVPRGPIFVLDIFNQGPKKIERTAKIMSEYAG
ncbi:hypothetical protein K7887_22475 (plasmid) [Sutcliffiella horikoshii]|uniref:hypothetical protein n=1 Tax=Sutcliffiella horikoshii TaxID=79883 RepID=UPI001CBC744D|nr:hypothetical protein [Sutcliffiella horikoshii]UAL49886.1 hypothetical protein K7887_22475 [Sutcliffiella horikoshii]